MQQYCYHCMRKLTDSPVCAYCGHSNNDLEVAPYHMLPGTLLAGKYLVGEVLGEGGFGITYIGLHTVLSKRIAIKEFYPSGAANRTNTVSEDVIITKGKEEFFKKGVDRFLLEAKNVASFYDVDAVVDVIDYFQGNGTAYIVMEYVDGETLKHYVNTKGRFQADRLIGLLIPVMKSLSYMHAQGIIHRDISPDNIMLTKRGRMKLMDFGSARYYTNEEREMSVILKQGFAPEEQYRRNGNQGPHTDVYSLCATIYACITGMVPTDSLDRMANDTLKRPSELGVAISPQQEKALMHGLAVKVEDRTKNMDELIKEFNTKDTSAYSSASTQTKPASTSYQPTVNTAGSYQPTVNTAGSYRPTVNTAGSYQQTVNTAGSYQPTVNAADSYQTQVKQAENKSKKTLIIIIIILSALIIAGLVAGIIINNPFGKGKSGGSGSSSSASSGVSEPNGGTTSRISTNNHSVFTSDKVYILEDSIINTTDSEAQSKIKKYMDDTNLQDTIDSINKQLGSIYHFDYLYQGNTVVVQCKFTSAATDAMKTQVKTQMENQQMDIPSMRTAIGVDNYTVVIALVNHDGSIYYSRLVKD